MVNHYSIYQNKDIIVGDLKILLNQIEASVEIDLLIAKIGTTLANALPQFDSAELYQALEISAQKFSEIIQVSGTMISKGEELILHADTEDYRIDKKCATALKADFYDDQLGELCLFGIVNANNLMRVIALFQQGDFKELSGTDIQFISTGISGLDRLLFPGTEREVRGFYNPKCLKNEKLTVPQVVLIKGAPGSGKTTLAIQMLIRMAKNGLNCIFWSNNNNQESIINIARNYHFLDSEAEIKALMNNKERIHFEYKNFHPLHKMEFPKISIDTNVFFLDSLNLSNKEISRDDIWTLFNKYRQQKILAFIFLEDYGTETTENIRQLIADCEFFADVVIQLNQVQKLDYNAFVINIKKKHYGSQSHGEHAYKICGRNHSLVNLEKAIRARRLKEKGLFPNDYYTSGIFVYPSIHRHLSGTRKLNEEIEYTHTGITHLDEILQGNDFISESSMPNDSCIIIRGEKGSHKLTLGLNLLMGGMWKPKSVGDKKEIRRNNDVLLILLDEEANINIEKTAIAKYTHLLTAKPIKISNSIASLDNGQWITWLDKNSPKCLKKECNWYDLFDPDKNQIGQKVVFKNYCAQINQNEHAKVLIAGFRPGFITPEEFIYIISRLINPMGIPGMDNPEPVFSRVLFVSTDHLRMRFPLLYNEKLFLPSLIDLLKSQRITSILIDVVSEGSDKALTYGLSALAD